MKERRNITILALDTAMSGMSVAVLNRDGRCVGQRIHMPRGQAEALVPMCERVMEEAGLAYGDLDGIITTRGPGAFTGLRVGLSTAKAFGLALDIPVWGITTLQALALGYVERAAPRDPFVVLVETRRTDLYVQRFDPQGRAVSEPAARAPEDISDAYRESTFIGDGALRLGIEVDEADTRPDARVMARAHSARPDALEENPEPLYLRPPDVSPPKSNPRRLGRAL